MEERISLKTFWETVESRLAEATIEELRAILRSMAQNTPPSERQRFLQKLQPPIEDEIGLRQALSQEDLLSDIYDLTRELQVEMENADEMEDAYGWDNYYDDEDSLGLYEKFIEPLTSLLDRAQAAFEIGDLTLAHSAYKKLFDEIIDQEDDYGRGIHAGDLPIEIPEMRARYLRTVYETEPLESRPEIIFRQMLSTQSLTPYRSKPMFDDLIQITPRQLPDQEEFFSAWINYLKGIDSAPADAWLREAVRLSQGVAGLEELAQTEGETRPRAYLDWFAALRTEGKHAEILAAAQEALERLPVGLPIRAAIADHLCEAADHLGETETSSAGRWQAFLAKPTLPRLIDVWDATQPDTERIKSLRLAANYIKDYLAHPPDRQLVYQSWEGDTLESFARIDRSVLAHALLLAHEFNAAYELAADAKVLGWSSSDNVQSLVLPFFLVFFSGKSPDDLPPNLAELWQQGLYLGISHYWDQWDDITQHLARIHAENITNASLPANQQEEILTWCSQISMERVSAIVSNQYRKSYHKAARIIVACAEVLHLQGKHTQAETMMNDIRDRFPRHRAFQSELKEAIRQGK